MRISPRCHSLQVLRQPESTAQRAVLCNSDRYRKGKHPYPSILSIPLANSCPSVGRAFGDSDKLSETSPPASLRVFSSNKMLIQIKAVLRPAALTPQRLSTKAWRNNN